MQKANLTKVDFDSLFVGQKIHYRYAVTEVEGPFTVLKLWRDSDGNKTLLRGVVKRNGDRTILLADDEDYGALSIYTTPQP